MIKDNRKNENSNIIEEAGKTFSILMVGLGFAGAVGFSIGMMNDAMEKYFSQTAYLYMGICLIIGLLLQGFFIVKIEKNLVFGLIAFFLWHY